MNITMTPEAITTDVVKHEYDADRQADFSAPTRPRVRFDSDGHGGSAQAAHQLWCGDLRGGDADSCAGFRQAE